MSRVCLFWMRSYNMYTHVPCSNFFHSWIKDTNRSSISPKLKAIATVLRPLNATNNLHLHAKGRFSASHLSGVMGCTHVLARIHSKIFSLVKKMYWWTLCFAKNESKWKKSCPHHMHRINCVRMKKIVYLTHRHPELSDVHTCSHHVLARIYCKIFSLVKKMYWWTLYFAKNESKWKNPAPTICIG